MTRTFFFIVFVLSSHVVLSQNIGYKSYLENDYELFAQLDSNFMNHFLKPLKIKGLTEKCYTYDTLGELQDSLILNVYRFDSLGRIIEHQFDFRFVWDQKKFKHRSLTYTYEKDGTITYEFNDPFGMDYILSGIYVSDKFYMYCEYRNNSYQLESVNVKTSAKEEINTLLFFYDQRLFVHEYIYKEYLLSGFDYLVGNKIRFRHVIHYEK